MGFSPQPTPHPIHRPARAPAPTPGRAEPGGDHDHKDALPSGPVRGRGAGLNPGNRFEDIRLHVLGEHLDEHARERPLGTLVGTRVLPDAARGVINPVDSKDLNFKWTVNPYRGCEHGCIYCYARPGHEYLGLSSGLDFETTILAKHEAPRLLREELARPSWKGEPIMFAGVTDVYQPVERELRITRRCLEVMLEFGQPLSIVTKSKLILRDLDLLRELAARNLVHVAVSITTLDNALAGAMEPRAASPRARLDVIRTLAAEKIPVMVFTAPIIPGLTDHEIPRLLQESHRAGAAAAGYVLLRLPYQIKALFLDWLQREYPDRAARIEHLIRDTRSGALYDSRWRIRQKGEGEIAAQIARVFQVFQRKYKLDGRLPEFDRTQFRKIGRCQHEPENGQLGLFGATG